MKSDYNEGMAYAYRIAKQGGIDVLEKEIQFRGLYNYDTKNATIKDIWKAAAKLTDVQLRIMAIASIAAMADGLKLPPSIMVDYLVEFNSRVGIYMEDMNALEEAEKLYGSRYDLGIIGEKYIKTKKENENGVKRQ